MKWVTLFIVVIVLMGLYDLAAAMNVEYIKALGIFFSGAFFGMVFERLPLHKVPKLPSFRFRTPAGRR